jgi:hypothetical protein
VGEYDVLDILLWSFVIQSINSFINIFTGKANESKIIKMGEMLEKTKNMRYA